MKRIFIGLITVALLLMVRPSSTSAKPSSDKENSQEAAARPELVVSTQWLAAHLSDPHLVLVHVGHDLNAYQAAHIPGARFLSMDKFADHQTEPGVELLPPDQLKKNLEEIGISDDSRVVYYSPDWDPMATRLFFTLDYIGHGDQAALLDGGIEQWLREKRPTSRETVKAAPGSLTIHLHPEIVAKMDWMKKLVSNPSDKDVVIVDARPMKRYREGHLAGAQPMYWENALVSDKDPVLKSPQQLRQMFAAAGVTADKKEVSYCEVGLQASYTYFLARYLGYNAAMYDGSYREWDAAKLPAVSGDSPR